MTREEKINTLKAIIQECEEYEWQRRETLFEIIKDLEQASTTKDNLALIRTDGLDEEIRCTMCTNYMKSDRGCDGSCVVNKDMYKAVMDAIEKRIQPTTKNDIAQERYQDLIDYFDDKEVAKTILEDRKEFKAWLERLRWNVKRADELARELGQLRPTTKDCLLVEQIVDKVIEKAMSIKPKDVIPQEPRCKECKWWKDSDGKYRRGCGAESQCPINTHAVYCGEGYCYMFSPKTDMSEVENDKRRTKKALPKTN